MMMMMMVPARVEDSLGSLRNSTITSRVHCVQPKARLATQLNSTSS